MLEQMEIAESIYEGIVEPSYKKVTREDANRACNSSQNRGESASLQTNSAMGKRLDKFRKQYVDCPSSESKTVLSTAPGILLTNAMSWETLVLSMLKVSLVKTPGIIPYKRKI